MISKKIGVTLLGLFVYWIAHSLFLVIFVCTRIQSPSEVTTIFKKPPLIEVFYPHFNNPMVLNLSLSLMKLRSSGKVEYGVTIVTQEDEAEERAKIRAMFEGGIVKVFEFPQPGRFGGSALLGFFQFINLLNHDIEITITSDVDTNNWDLRVKEIFEDPDVVLAGINPRRGPFKDSVEWNWMAFRSSFFYLPIIERKLEGLHDWGNAFTNITLSAGKKQYLWKNAQTVLQGRSPTVVGDELDPYWLLHMFYTTRLKKDKSLGQGEKAWIVTAEEAQKMYKWCSQKYITKPFAMGDFE